MEMLHISKAEFDRIGTDENSLLYLERVETSAGDFALPGGDTISTSKNWKIYNAARA